VTVEETGNEREDRDLSALDFDNRGAVNRPQPSKHISPMTVTHAVQTQTPITAADFWRRCFYSVLSWVAREIPRMAYAQKSALVCRVIWRWFWTVHHRLQIFHVRQIAA